MGADKSLKCHATLSGRGEAPTIRGDELAHQKASCAGSRELEFSDSITLAQGAAPSDLSHYLHEGTAVPGLGDELGAAQYWVFADGLYQRRPRQRRAGRHARAAVG